MSTILLSVTIFALSVIAVGVNSQSFSSSCRNTNCFGSQQTCVEVVRQSSSSGGESFSGGAYSSVTSIKRIEPKCVSSNKYGDYCGPENGNGGPYIQNNFPDFPCQSDEKCIVTQRCATNSADCYPAVKCVPNNSGNSFGQGNNYSPIGCSSSQFVNSPISGRESTVTHCGDAVICPAGQQCITLRKYPPEYRCTVPTSGSENFNSGVGNNVGTANENDNPLSCGPNLTCRPDQMCITLKTFPPRYQCVNNRDRGSGSSNDYQPPQLYSDDDNMPPGRTSLRPVGAAPTRCAQLHCAVNRPGTVCIKVQPRQTTGATLPLTAQCVPQVNDPQDYCQARFGLCSADSRCALAIPKCVASNSMTTTSECVPFVTCLASPASGFYLNP